jgi:hypothetical protein
MGTVIDLFSRANPQELSRAQVKVDEQGGMSLELPDPFGPLDEDQHERFMGLCRQLDETTDHDAIVKVMLAIQKEVVGWSVT